VYSCNVPVPAEVSRLARGLARECREATPRDRHSLVLKRLGDGDPGGLAGRVRRTLAGTAPFEVRVTGVGVFREPPVGRGPVAYLSVESPRLLALHRELCAAFDPVDGIEGDDYVPHVTVARGGDADRLAGRSIEARTWTVESLTLWSAEYDEGVERLSLPV
jgi:2'-5' RNA ligase